MSEFNILDIDEIVATILVFRDEEGPFNDLSERIWNDEYFWKQKLERIGYVAKLGPKYYREVYSYLYKNETVEEAFRNALEDNNFVVVEEFLLNVSLEYLLDVYFETDIDDIKRLILERLIGEYYILRLLSDNRLTSKYVTEILETVPLNILITSWELHPSQRKEILEFLDAYVNLPAIYRLKIDVPRLNLQGVKSGDVKMYIEKFRQLNFWRSYDELVNKFNIVDQAFVIIRNFRPKLYANLLNFPDKKNLVVECIKVNNYEALEYLLDFCDLNALSRARNLGKKECYNVLVKHFRK